MHYSLMGKMRLQFLDSGLLYRGALSGRFDCIIDSDLLYRGAL